jgi:hypothetical protein
MGENEPFDDAEINPEPIHIARDGIRLRPCVEEDGVRALVAMSGDET